MVIEAIRDLFRETLNEPYARRRRSISDRTASWRMRGLAVAFLSGLCASIAVLVYDRRQRDIDSSWG